MILADVNVLVYAFATQAPDHGRYPAWLDRAVAGPEPFGVSELVLSAVVRTCAGQVGRPGTWYRTRTTPRSPSSTTASG